jgi:hypothetical protein
LQAGLDALKGEEAVLNARIVGWETTEARWGPLASDVDSVEGKKRDCEVVIDRRMFDERNDRVQHGHMDMDRLAEIMQDLIKRETESAREGLNVETGDLWRLSRVRVTSSSSNDEDERDEMGKGFVVLVVHHIITDGMGGLEFFSQVLQRAVRYDQDQRLQQVQVHSQVEGEGEGDAESQPLLGSHSHSHSHTQTRPADQPTASEKETPTTMRRLPPALESTIRVKPAISTLLRAVWYELVVPKFPAWLQRFFVDENAAKVWIGRGAVGGDGKIKSEAAKQDQDGDQDEVGVEADDIGVDISTLACHCSVVPLSAELVGRLVQLSTDRQAAEKNPTRVKLTSLLVAALMLAIHSTFDDSAIRDGMYIEGNIPMSERNLELGHPAFLGNLMVPAMHRKWFPADAQGEARKTEQERFWDVAEDLAGRLEGGEMRKSGRETWGLCAHIPDGQREKMNEAAPGLTSTSRRRGAFTGWEEYFGAPHKRTKYSHSVQFSNLGRVSPSFPKVDAVVWGHPAACFDAHAVEVDCVGSAGGEVWMSVNWREGSGVDGVLIERVVKEMRELLGRLVAGTD